MNSKKIIVALDSNDLNKTICLVETLKNEAYAFKLGYQFFFNFGLDGYKKIFNICPNIFLDLKLHDIPNTVKNGLEAIIKIKPLLTTIHISGGDEMMKASKFKKNSTKILYRRRPQTSVLHLPWFWTAGAKLGHGKPRQGATGATNLERGIH